MRLTLALLAALSLPLPVAAAEITVFAASSLKTALDRIAADWQAETGNSAVIAYDGSAKLAKQIEQGAPADVFISAAVDWMDLLQTGGLIREDTRRDLLGNDLVLVAHGAGAAPVEIGTGLDLPALLAGGKLAIGQVDSVPAGQYGKAALESLGLWPAVQADVAQVDNVRAALALVAQGEAPLGIVFASDAVAGKAAGDDIAVLGTFPEGSHPPITYPAAVVAASERDEAADFLDYLSSPAAKDVFRSEGFKVAE